MICLILITGITHQHVEDIFCGDGEFDCLYVSPLDENLVLCVCSCA